MAGCETGLFIERGCSLRALGEFVDAVSCGSRPSLGVSACLLGVPCRFDGDARPSDSVQKLASWCKEKGCRVVRACPERLGGLASPRPPAELAPDGRVFDATGLDATDRFVEGAQRAFDKLRGAGVHFAVLKSKSPSCACHEVFDGTFSGRLVPGMGVVARLCAGAGIGLADENDVARFGVCW